MCVLAKTNICLTCACFCAASVKTEPGAAPAGSSPPVMPAAPASAHAASAATAVKQEQGADHSAHDLIK